MWWRRLVDFFLFTSLFLACCAVLMAAQTAVLFDRSPPLSVYLFVACGTVCSYNFHAYFATATAGANRYKIRWNLAHKPLHAGLSLCAFAGALVAAWPHRSEGIWLAVGVALAFLYTAPKLPHPIAIHLQRVAVAKTIYLAAAWTYITSLLPLLLTTGLSSSAWLFALNRFLFLYAVCIVFDRRDVLADRAAGIKSLVTWLGNAGIDRLFWGVWLAALGSLAALAGLFTTPILLSLAVPVVALGAVYPVAKRSQSDYLYDFLLDGLMALSAPMVILAKFAR